MVGGGEAVPDDRQLGGTMRYPRAGEPEVSLLIVPV